MSIGIAYAIWSGLGTVGIALIGVWLWGERLSWSVIGGIVLAIIGVVLINLATDGVR